MCVFIKNKLYICLLSNTKKNLMKRISLVALCAIFLVFTAKAQKAGFGLKGGIVASTVEIEQTGLSDFSPRASGYGGICYIYQATDHWAIQPEILYTPQGCKIKDSYLDDDSSVEFNLNYIQVPILAKYYFNPIWSIEFGPQFQVLTSSEIKATALGLSESTNTDELFNTLDIGIAFGSSVHFQEHIFMDLRINIGARNIINESDGISIYNRSIQVGLGYTF